MQHRIYIHPCVGEKNSSLHERIQNNLEKQEGHPKFQTSQNKDKSFQKYTTAKQETNYPKIQYINQQNKKFDAYIVINQVKTSQGAMNEYQERHYSSINRYEQ